MSERVRLRRPGRQRAAAAVWTTSLAATVATLGLFGLDVTDPAGRSSSDVAPRLLFPLIATAFATVAFLILSRAARNTIGRLFGALGLAVAFGGLSWEYGIRATVVRPDSLPLGDWAFWVGNWLPFAMLAAIPLLLLEFPDRSVLGRRWAIVRWIAIAGVPAFLLQDMQGHMPRALVVALGGEQAAGRLFDNLIAPPASLISAAALLGALAAMVVRVRRAGSEQRHQMKWLAMAGVVVMIVAAFNSAGGFHGNPLGAALAAAMFLAGLLFIPIAVGIAILKYRLYDIDLVISRALVYGALAAFITAVYVAIVVGVGSLVGSGGRPNLVLSIVATALVAVAFQPLRERTQRVANRVVYGRRATPYEVLSRFSSQVADNYAGEEALSRMARVLAEGTGAQAAAVWLSVGRSLRPVACWPATTSGNNHTAVEVTGESLPVVPGADRVVAVRHQGELLGALTVSLRPGGSMTPIEENLLEHLASQAGLVLKNVGLTADLQARLEDLRASRQRLVAAQDHERRRLERNLHDGAQQHLVAIKVKLGLAEKLADTDPARAQTTLRELKADTDEALQTLRDLARGIFPPLLADQGLEAAIRAQARKAPLNVTVEAAGVGRYSQEVEAAVYFCCLEALQNIEKYAGAENAAIMLSHGSEHTLKFEVRDDGGGFDPATAPRGSGLLNLDDRLAALGGLLAIESSPGEGTRILGSVPLPSHVGIPA